MLAAQEKRNRELLDRHDNLLSTFRICLKNSSSFEEFKKMCKSELDARDAVDFEVGQTERDIEEAFGEFANSDGTLDEERLEPSY
jgi:hypothetical protein